MLLAARASLNFLRNFCRANFHNSATLGSLNHDKPMVLEKNRINDLYIYVYYLFIGIFSIRYLVFGIYLLMYLFLSLSLSLFKMVESEVMLNF